MNLFFIVLATLSLSNPGDEKGAKKVKYKAPEMDKELVYIPQSSFLYKEADPNKIGEEYVQSSVVTTKGFYMYPYEVSNLLYREFLYNLKVWNDSLYPLALPDTLVWREKLSYGEPYVEYYFRHPAYSDYPVVGITHQQAKMYCEWLTSKYMENPKRKYKSVKFRLPTKYEWYAATQLDLRSEKEKIKNTIPNYESGKIFPWEGFDIYRGDGQMRANCVRVNNSTVVREYDTIYKTDGSFETKLKLVSYPQIDQGIDFSSVGYDIIAPAKSYWPNEAGIYNLGGNVEEMVEEYGITKGGSWYDTGYFLRNEVIETYKPENEATSQRGFRFVMEITEDK